MKLMERMKRKGKGNKGFTLVEMILTISIMAVLLGVVGVQINGYLEKARIAKDQEIIDSFAMAAVNYYSSHLDEFAEVRERGGKVAFTVFYVKAVHTYNVSPGYSTLTTDITNDWSFGIQKLAGYYCEDDKDLGNYNVKREVESKKAREKLAAALSSKEARRNTRAEDIMNDGREYGEILNDLVVAYDFSTRTVTVTTRYGGDVTDGSGHFMRPFTCTVPF